MWGDCDSVFFFEKDIHVVLQAFLIAKFSPFVAVDLHPAYPHHKYAIEMLQSLVVPQLAANFHIIDDLAHMPSINKLH